ncbi:MAG: hypothetical protein ACRDBQ_18410 [Shewanella sp.]
MFTVLRKVNGNRTPTEHKTVTLGGPESDVFKDAIALIESQDSIDYLSPATFRTLEPKAPAFVADCAKVMELITPICERQQCDEFPPLEFFDKIKILQEIFGVQKVMELCDSATFRLSLDQGLYAAVHGVSPVLSGGGVVIVLTNNPDDDSVETLLRNSVADQFYDTEEIAKIDLSGAGTYTNAALVLRSPKKKYFVECPDEPTFNFKELENICQQITNLCLANGSYRLSYPSAHQLMKFFSEDSKLSAMLANQTILSDIGYGINVCRAKDVAAGKVNFSERGLWIVLGVKDHIPDLDSIPKGELEHGDGFCYYLNTKDSQSLSVAILGKHGLVADPYKRVSIDSSEEITEVSSVETYFIPTGEPDIDMHEQILVARRRGSRALSDAIGVLSYQAEEIFKDENGDEMKCDGACYEFFYPGDQVYVTNSVGKTVDSIR